MTRAGYIAIVGRPNVGKSTLLNLILKEKIAIVTDKPQTTRNKIVGIAKWKDAQYVFLDTPGFHLRPEKLNRYMVSVVRGAIADADVVLFLTEPVPAGGEDKELWGEIKKSRKQAIYVVNKVDILNRDSRFRGNDVDLCMESHRLEHDLKEAFAISAKENLGVEAVLDRVYDFIPEGGFLYPEDQLTEHPLRFLASEIIREKVTDKTYDEIPYCVAVEIEEFKEPPLPEIVRIRANIIVAKDSQKGIVIGERGAMIKAIGTEARKEIESLMDRKVFLELYVKVEKEWTKDDNVLKRLGYSI